MAGPGHLAFVVHKNNMCPAYVCAGQMRPNPAVSYVLATGMHTAGQRGWVMRGAHVS